MTTIAHGAGDLIAVESVQVRDEVGQAVRAIQAVPDQQEKFVTELVLNKVSWSLCHFSTHTTKFTDVPRFPPTPVNPFYQNYSTILLPYVQYNTHTNK